jgi:hypothetical protein
LQEWQEKMTKKDYELIAGVIADTTDITNILADLDMESAERVIVLIAQRLASSLEMENPLFNRDKFLTACGVN